MPINPKINFSKFTSFQYLVAYAAFLLTVKLLLLPFTQAIDADGVSRVYLSMELANNFHIIKSGIWPPLFFYIMGEALKIYYSQKYTLLIVNILLSVAALFPLFFLMKRFFDNKIAFILCLIFSLSPIVFRLSLITLAETSFYFFIISGVIILVIGLVEKRSFYVLIAGLLFSIAGGCRYESWMLALLVAIIITLNFSLKQAVLFIIPAMLFPLYWLVSNYYNSQHMLSSFTWIADAVQMNKFDSLESFFRRIWWFPLSLMFAFGPVAFYFFIREIINVCKNRKTQKLPFQLLIMFFVVFLIWIFNCLRGSLLLQHRFSLTLFLLSFPFLGFYFKNKIKHTLKIALLFAVTSFFLAFCYSSKGARPIPRLLNKDAYNVSQIIKENITSDSGFINDFWDWEGTYFLAFESGLPLQNIFIAGNELSDEKVKSRLMSVLQAHHEGCILFYRKGNLFHNVSFYQNFMNINGTDIQIEISSIFSNKDIEVYKYIW